MDQVLVARASDQTIGQDLLDEMFQFRHRIFHENLGWNVVSHNGMERDIFDDLNPVYIVARNFHNEVEGFWRFLPTTGPYMLKDTFPQLLCGNEAPQDPCIWELSRFAVMPKNRNEHTQVVMSSLAITMIRSAFDFAEQHGIQRYVTVVSVAVERLMKRIGLPIFRLNSQIPQRIGKVATVDCYIDITDETRKVVYDNYLAITAPRKAA